MSASHPVVVALGEALFDCFPDRTVLGGAPINFAVHLQQLLGEPAGQAAVVCGIGADALGQQLIDEIGDRRVSTELLQTVSDRATGQVQVSFGPNGEPAYHIAENAAWDFLRSSAAVERVARESQAIYFGTLSQRSARSRDAIQAIVQAANGLRVLDVNLRPPHYGADVLDSSLTLASVVKLNEDELLTIAELLLPGSNSDQSADALVARLLQRYSLKVAALTRGERGTVLYADDRRVEGVACAAPPKSHGADSVGAGDACCAGLVYGMLKDWPLEQTVELANRMGAWVSSQPGGTPKLSEELLGMTNGLSAPGRATAGV